jgi:hypothetical protein
MKYVVTANGPVQRYRLDIIKECFPDVLNSVIIFTDKFSYDLYRQYHDVFNFVIIDDYRNQFKFSVDNEVFFNAKSDSEYFAGVREFYSVSHNRLYSYDIHRFAFLYLLNEGITSFALIDSDVILQNNPAAHASFNDNLPDGCFHAPFMGREGDAGKINFLENVYPYFGFLNKPMPHAQAMDGWIRGFKFKSKTDMTLFFNIWNKSIELLYTDENLRLQFHTGCVIADFGFICQLIMGLFKDQFNYQILNSMELNLMYPQRIFHHTQSVEDQLYWDRYGQWSKFNYTDISSIPAFISNNKEKLMDHYAGPVDVRITDSHIYTYLK